MRRCLCMLLCAVLCLCLLPLSGFAQEVPIASEAAVLMDTQTGQILLGRDMDVKMYPASITKVMTGLVALKYGDPKDTVTMTLEGYSQVPRTSSHIALLPGEEFTMEDALYALALVSANDAAVAIAQTVSGSVEEFCDLMNQEATALGAVNTHFSNPNGLPAEDHYTTAQDMALITAAALEQPDFLTYFGAKSYTMPATNLSEPRELVSKNQFIDGTVPCEGLLMSKTGWTSQALGTLVTAARRGDTTLVAVTMRSAMLEDKYADTAALIDFGFSAFRRVRLSESLIKRKMVEQGMDADSRLEGYEPVDVMLPVSDGEADIEVTVPGGFDGSLGLQAVPVSVDAQEKDGTRIHLTDLLLSIQEVLQEEAEEASVPEPEESRSGSNVSPGVWLLLAAAAVFTLLWYFTRRKQPKKPGICHE